jgi:hypothetical protein
MHLSDNRAGKRLGSRQKFNISCDFLVSFFIVENNISFAHIMKSIHTPKKNVKIPYFGGFG